MTYPSAEPERRREYCRVWRANPTNAEKARASGRASEAKHGKKYRARKFLVKYGETIEENDARFAGQNFSCAACGAPEPGSKVGWHTDHDHARGKVRGILCHGCNVAIGYAKDDPVRLRKIAIYLETNS